MVKSADIKDRDSLEEWLNTRPREDAIWIAHRAALRVLPLWGAEMDADWARQRDLTALPILRCGLISAVAATLPTAEIKFNAANAAARAAAYAAADAANANAARAAADAAANAAARAALLWEQVGRDAQLLEQGQDLGVLWVGEAPAYFTNADNKMQDIWRADPPARWDFWRRWWEAAKAGKPRNPQLQLAIIEGVDNDTWDDPDATAERIAEIEEHFDPQGVESTASVDSEPDDIGKTLDLLKEQAAELSALYPSIQDEFRSRFEGLSNDLTQVERRSEGLQKAYGKQASKFEQDFTNLQTAYQQKFESALAAFMEDQSIKAPVELWQGKEREHSKNAESAFRTFAWGLGLMAAFLVIVVCVLLFGGDSVVQAFSPYGCAPDKPELCRGFSFQGAVVVGSILTITTLALWYLRLRMKVYLSERHLMLDARERRAFAQTYIGFVREGDTSEEAQNQRSLIYAALFRPGADGIIAEDGGIDPSVTAAFSKFLSSK